MTHSNRWAVFTNTLVEETKSVMKVEAVLALTRKAIAELEDLGFEIENLEEKAGSAEANAVREWNVNNSHYRVWTKFRVQVPNAQMCDRWPELQTTEQLVLAKCLEAAHFQVIPTVWYHHDDDSDCCNCSGHPGDLDVVIVEDLENGIRAWISFARDYSVS